MNAVLNEVQVVRADGGVRGSDSALVNELASTRSAPWASSWPMWRAISRR